MQEILSKLDGVRLNFSQDGLIFLNLTLAFIMFGVALEIKVENFRQIFVHPKPALVGILSQFIFLPAVTFLITILFRNIITPTIALGMILVASCPGGNISNFISALAKANKELSISLTAFSTIACIILTPFNFTLWGGFFIKLYNKYDASALVRPLEIDPYYMFQTVFILLGIPILIGMLCSWKLPKFTSKISKPIKILSIILFFGIVIALFSNNYEHFIKYIKYIFIIVFIHNSLGFLTGFSLGSVFKLKSADIRTVTIETGIQNSGLGLILLFNTKIFPTELAIGGMAFIAAWWGIWHILSGLSLAGLWYRRPYTR
ncbi:MAG: bile acid:sodium symporter family protein [Bacteroidales bacterium]|nr:bile acid:sodium symporter family protein [Bacteroidales bacterium]